MKLERSCGAVVFTRQKGELEYLVIKQRNGVVAFPKGHMEGAETEEETALREIAEEVGLTPRLIPGFRAVDRYPLPNRPGVTKQVVFFLAQYEGQTVTIQPSELLSATLAPYDRAMAMLTHDSTRRILGQAHAFLTEQL